MKSVREAEVSGKRVILRGDLDIPLEDGKVADDTRLRALLPTLKYLLKNRARVLIIGHLGRPKGKRDPKLSLEPVARRLDELVGQRIAFVASAGETPPRKTPGVSPSTPGVKKSAGLEGAKVLAMLENLRFWPGESLDPARDKEGQDFAKRLASLGDLYVNDAFAASHRAHASIVGIPQYLSSYAGLRLEEEVRQLGGVLENPERPLIFIIGGAKTETKKPLVPRFAKIADKILLGGLLMYAQELEGIPGVIFPVDSQDACDIGPKTIKLFAGIIKEAKTVVWNGPLGVWEDNRYELGTRAVAEELALLPGKTIVGGGDTTAALNAFGFASKMSYVSLGGGAMLEFLAGKKLPGLVTLGYYTEVSRVKHLGGVIQDLTAV